MLSVPRTFTRWWCKCTRRDRIVKLKKRGIVGSGVRIEFGVNIRGKSA